MIQSFVCIAVLASLGEGADTTGVSKKLSPYFQRVISGIQTTQAKKSKKHSLHPAGPSIQANGDTLYSAIIYTTDVQELRNAGIQINSIRKKFVTVHITPGQLRRISALDAVKYIREVKMRRPNNDIAAGLIGARSLQKGAVNDTSYTGEGVLVCDIDTGIDWKHLDFRDSQDTTKSRIIFLWDQTLAAGASDTKVKGYGVLYTQAQMNNELNGSPANFVREADNVGHGTHVMGTIAGNGGSMKPSYKYAGMAPKAGILFVKTDFSDAGIIDALDWADSIATVLGKPLVINMSLGSVLSAHDGTEDDEIVVDEINTGGRRAVAISAGNDGETNCHVSGTIAAGGSAVITFLIPSYGQAQGYGNDYVYMDAWINGDANITGSLLSPRSKTLTAAAESSPYLVSSDGYLEIDNFLYTVNNKRELFAVVSDDNGASAPKSGTWTFTLTNNTASAQSYHCWFQSDLGTDDAIASVASGDNNYVVASPGNAASAITAAAYVSRWFWSATGGSIYYDGTPINADNIAAFSSGGPRVDNVQKPDIAAPGEELISAFPGNLSISAYATSVTPDLKHQVMAGTSMAAPCVAGSCALLFQQNPSLTAAQIKSLITSTATTDSYTGTSLPQYKWGYGKLDVLKAMKKLISPSAPDLRTVAAYDQWSSYTSSTLSSTEKIAMRVTPLYSGKITGVFFHPYSTVALSGPPQAEILSDSSGFPGTLYAGPFTIDTSSVMKGSWNYLDLSTDTINVTANANYYIVLHASASPNDMLSLLFDTSTVNRRTSIYNGSSWSVYPWGNAHLRGVVTAANTAVSVAGASDASNVITKFSLMQNYPNPFNPATTIQFSVAKDGRAVVKAFDILGREVAALYDDAAKAGQYYTVVFNGSRLSSGVYFYIMESNNQRIVKKMLLLK